MPSGPAAAALAARVQDRSVEAASWPRTIGSALQRAASTWPDAEALVEGERRWTFTQYLNDVDDLARGLLARGVRHGERVAIWAPNSAEVAIAAMAVYSVGASVVPLSTRLTVHEAGELVERAGVALVLSVGDFLGRDYLTELRHRLGPGERPLLVAITGKHPDAVGVGELVDDGRAVDAGTLTARRDAVSTDDISDLIFTSGTTGAPKGAMLCHGASTRGYTQYGRTLGLVPGDRMIGIAPFFHTFGLKGIVLTAVLYGAAVLPVATFDAKQLADLIEREHATVLQGSPTIFLGLMDDPAIDPARLHSLRVAGPGSMGFSPAGFARIRDELGITEFSPGYALTESSAVGTRVYWFDDFETASTTSGRPVPGVELRIVTLAGEPAPAGNDGEILLRGYNVMRGYFEDPDATTNAIDADGWLHTGDVGHLDDRGRLTVTDRIKDVFLVGGFNAYPAEIERILGECPAVAEIAVIGVPDGRLGEVGRAFVVPRDAATFDVAVLENFARERLANFKRPRRYDVLGELPRNSSGKVQKFRLRARMETAAGPDGDGGNG